MNGNLIIGMLFIAHCMHRINLWTDREDNILRQYYKIKGINWCCIIIGRSYSAIKGRACKLQLTNKQAKHDIDETGYKYNDWTIILKLPRGWLCQCQCGYKKIWNSLSYLRRGKTKSCLKCYKKRIKANIGKKYYN